ncbi:MAG: peptidyl-prolyl cis-trans isomerase [Thiogranum sp.]
MKLAREPLVHFLLLAALLFVLEAVFSTTQKEQIIVDQQTAEFLIKQREDLELRKLGSDARKETIDTYVEDEILYSEAYKRGLDKGDSRMRRNMILKMRGLLIGDLEQPTDDQLRAYYEARKDQFTRPATISIQQVFFSDPAQVPPDLLARLQGGLDHESVGEFLPGLGRSMSNVSQWMIVSNFGADAARVILAINHDQWHGPIESIQGIHFIRITARTPEYQSSYDEVKSYIEGYWTMAQSRKLIEQEIERLQENYEIVIEDDAGAGQ